MSDPYGPCEPWPVLWPCELGASSPTATGIAVQVATELLWAMSGRQFGLCEATLRPCRRDCWQDAWQRYPGVDGLWPGQGWSYPQPALVGGQWLNLVCGACPGTCGCQALSEVLLPAPVHHVVEVRLDGTPMASGAWRLDDARKLVRVDGGVWPWCQDLAADDDQPGAFAVTAVYGREPPHLAALAVGEVACQWLRAMRGEDCHLPANLTSLARQGVSISLPDPATLLESGQLGLYWADLFLRAYNPGRLHRRAGVYNVDHMPPRRTRTG
jgi:hypothetical protein